MYNNKLVAVIKQDGKVLREQGDKVSLPFCSEYSVYLKNVNSEDVVVSIEIDGQDVLSGNHIVIRVGESTNITGVLDKKGVVKNKFKFIEKTAQISKHRGDRAEDGLVKITYQFVKPTPQYVPSVPSFPETTPWKHNPVIGPNPWCPGPHYPYQPFWYGTDDCPPYGGITYSNSSSDIIGADVNYVQVERSDASPPLKSTLTTSGRKGKWTAQPIGAVYSPPSPNIDTKLLKKLLDISDEENKEGITVKGSPTDQEFFSTSVGCLEDMEHVIVFHLQGQGVEKPVTTRTKLVCSTCGLWSKSSCTFCSRCSTCLT